MSDSFVLGKDGSCSQQPVETRSVREKNNGGVSAAAETLGGSLIAKTSKVIMIVGARDLSLVRNKLFDNTVNHYLVIYWDPCMHIQRLPTNKKTLFPQARSIAIVTKEIINHCNGANNINSWRQQQMGLDYFNLLQ